MVQSPKAKASDLRWLETLPAGDYLAAQDIVLERLGDFLAEDLIPSQSALDALLTIDEHRQPTLAALTHQYVHATSLAFEIDERLWQSVVNYYDALKKIYQRFLDHYKQDPSSLPHDLPQIILNILDSERCLLKWHYFRHQGVGIGAWLQLHELYRLAEKEGCDAAPLWRYRNQGETSVTSVYLQILMLGTLSPSDMLKHEIEMVCAWLSEWCLGLSLSQDLDPARHLFYVDLNEDKGGRRTRRIHPASSYRYWDTDPIESRIAKAHVEMQHGKVPADLKLTSGFRLTDCQPLLEYLLTEWSRTGYQRQRRANARNQTNRVAHIVDGLDNVCQHIKSVANARRKGKLPSDASADPGKSFSNSSLLQLDGGGGVTMMTGEKWTFTNESKYGYGAVVPTAHNPWLRLGRLLAFHGDQDQRFAVVGVIRNIKHLPDDKCYVGIEVLSRRPVHVTLRNLDQKVHAYSPADTDIFLAATLTHEGGFPFASLYLPRDEERNMPPVLLVPTMEYIAKGNFELRSDTYVYKIRLGRIIEQKDDWVCVEACVVENPATPPAGNAA